MRKKNKDFVVGQCSPCALTSLLLDGVRCCKGERRWGRPDLMDPDGIPASEPGAKGPVITLFLPHQKPGRGVGRASLDILP